MNLAKNLMTSLQGRLNNIFNTNDALFYAKIDVEKHVVKKNNRPVFNNKYTGRAVMGKSKELVHAEKHLILNFKSLANAQKIYEPYKGPVHVMFLFHFANYYDSKKKRSSRLPDMSNLYQLPEDCLQLAGVIENDNQICSHDLSRRLPAIKNYLEVFIFKHDEDYGLNSVRY